MSVNCVELFNVLFSDQNNPYKNYILNFVDIFCNKYIYHPFIDTFYLNKTFNFDLNISFFNKNHIYLLPYRDYFYYNPFVDFHTYISNPNNSIFIFNYFFNFCNKYFSKFIENEKYNSKIQDGNMSSFKVSHDQIKIFFDDLNFFYNIAYKLFNIFQYIFYCFIFKNNNDFNNIKNDLIKIREELARFKSDLFFSIWVASTIFKYLIIVIDNLNNNFLLYNFYNVKFLIEFSLSFRYFYFVNISNYTEFDITDDNNLSKVLYFRSVLDDNIYYTYLPKFETMLSNINDTTFIDVFDYFTSKIVNIQNSFFYNLLKSLKNIYNKLLLPFNFDFNGDVENNSNNNDFQNYNFYINGKLRFNNCIINDNLFYISDKISNNNFVCINTIYPINCLAFNTDLFSITYDNDKFYYTNDSHSISLDKKNFYSYFWNLFYNNNFYFFISSPDKIKFNVDKRFLFNLLPYIPYKIEERFDVNISKFLSTKLDVGKTIPLTNICPLNFNISYNVSFIDLSFILLKQVLESRRKYLDIFNDIIGNINISKQEDNYQIYVFLYLLYVFIHIYIFNTIHVFNPNESLKILNGHGNLVDDDFVSKCAYLFNMYFIRFLYKIVDFSDGKIKIKSNIKDDIIKSYNIQNDNFSTDAKKNYFDLRINDFFSYILNYSFSEIKLSILINILNVIKKYVVTSDNINVSKNYTNIENEYKSDNDDFNFNVYNILYKF